MLSEFSGCGIFTPEVRFNAQLFPRFAMVLGELGQRITASFRRLNQAPIIAAWAGKRRGDVVMSRDIPKLVDLHQYWVSQD